MKLFKLFRNIALSAVIGISSGCTAQYIFVHPDETDIHQKPAIKPSKDENGKLVPAGGTLEGEIKLDPYIFYNSFRARLHKRIEDRVYVDVQESAIRQFSTLYDKTSYAVIARDGNFRKNDLYGDWFEREFSANVYKESQKLFTRSFQDALKDQRFYNEHIEPFIDFNIKRDKIPFTDKKIVETSKEESRIQKDDSVDDFDERLKNPHKTLQEEIDEDWFKDKLSDISFGLNVDFDFFKQSNNFGIQPYVKWLDLIKWTYSTRQHTIEHKLSFPVYNTGFGFTAETSETITKLNRLEFGINRAFTKNMVLGISGYQKFYDTNTGEENNEWGIAVGGFIRL